MTPIILDCDPGVDDALALMAAAGSAELDLLAVTTVAGNRPVDITYRNACRLLALAGRSDIPVHRGCERPIASAHPRCNLVHGEDGLGGVILPPERQHNAVHAVDALVQRLTRAQVGTITLVAVGPLTNLALAEIQNPGVLRRAKALLIMGGAYHCPGNVTPHAEFNFHSDAVAAQVVLSCGAQVQLFGLDVTSQVTMSAEWISSLPTHTRCGQAARAMLTAYAAEDPLLHDACPVAALIAPDLFEGKICSVSVDYRPGPTEGLATATRPHPDDLSQAMVWTTVRHERVLDVVRNCIDSLP